VNARDRQVARETVRHPSTCHHCNPKGHTMLVATLTFHTLADWAAPEPDEGVPDAWEATRTEVAEVLSATERRMRFRSTTPQNETYDWDAYRYDFGGVVGEQWAYGSSAELLLVEHHEQAICEPDLYPQAQA
jgi:hypothetical protein